MDDRRERNTGRSGRESGSKRKIFRRTVFLMLVCGVGLFIPLIGQLWNIAIVHHEEYQAEAVEQQTRDVEVAAFRGSIYDSSGDVLAMSATVYNLILSPRDLEASVDESKYKDEEGNADLTAYQAALQAKKDLVLDGVLAVLDLDREALADRLERTYSQYEVLKTNIEKEQAEQLRAFITENKLSHFLYLTPTTKRYYPYGDLAAHVLGFCNSEGGAYGVEAIYNDVLEGTVGRVVTTRTGTGVEMYDSYSEYVDAEDGCDLTLTIDTTIQSYAERILEEGIKAYDVQRGGWCVVLDPQTGAVLAMASSPDYDPNQYGTIRDESLRAQVEADVQAELEKRQGEKAEGKTDEEIYQEAVNAATGTAQNKQWRSQAVNDTYEPGSTFKALVLAAALEEGAVSESDTFYCPGYYMVEGWPKPISCSKKAPGHGTQTLAEAVQNSCNPAFMQIGQRLGIEKFYEYFQAFGLTEPTNIDLNRGGREYGLAPEHDDRRGPGGRLLRPAIHRHPHPDDHSFRRYHQRRQAAPALCGPNGDGRRRHGGGEHGAHRGAAGGQPGDQRQVPGDPHQRGDGREGHRQECPPGGLHHRRQDGHLGDHRPRRGGGVLHGLRPRRRPPDPGPAGLQHPSPVRGGEQHRHHRHLDQRRATWVPPWRAS